MIGRCDNLKYSQTEARGDSILKASFKARLWKILTFALLSDSFTISKKVSFLLTRMLVRV